MSLNSILTNFQAYQPAVQTAKSLDQTATTAGALSISYPPVATPPVGSTAQTPFVLADGNNWVGWTSGNRPQFISYQGNLYQTKGNSSDGSMLYSSVQRLPQGKNNLYINFTGNSRTDVIGQKTEQVQVGTQQVQVGTERVQTGTERVQTGTDRVQTGTDRVQTGTQRVQTGTETVLVGTERVQTGTERVQTGTQQVQVGTERVQTGERVVRVDTATEQVSLKVSRELDGKQDTGAIGEMLTRGTTQLSDANQFFTGTNFAKFQVSSLLGEDNQAVSSSTDPLTERKGADDMYVAGDPHVGGKGNNYSAVDVVPQSGFMTMFEDGTDTGRKVTINSHAEAINTQGNKAFTEYGFVIQDDNGGKTKAALSGGKLTITQPDGQVKTLLPGQEHIIGDATDPVGKFYYADMPGGENGTTEKRLVFES